MMQKSNKADLLSRIQSAKFAGRARTPAAKTRAAAAAAEESKTP